MATTNPRFGASARTLLIDQRASHARRALTSGGAGRGFHVEYDRYGIPLGTLEVASMVRRPGPSGSGIAPGRPIQANQPVQIEDLGHAQIPVRARREPTEWDRAEARPDQTANRESD